MTTPDLLRLGIGFLAGLLIGLIITAQTLRHVAETAFRAGYQRALAQQHQQTTQLLKP